MVASCAHGRVGEYRIIEILVDHGQACITDVAQKGRLSFPQWPLVG
jgi:hypothetical protein